MMGVNGEYEGSGGPDGSSCRGGVNKCCSVGVKTRCEH